MSEITNEERAMTALAATLGSPGWKLIVVPTLRNQILETADQLSKLDRPGTVPDDFLRGRVAGLKYALSIFSTQLTEFEQAKKLDSPPEPEQPVGSPYADGANLPLEGAL